MDKISKIKIADDTPTHIKNATSHVYIQSLFKGGGQPHRPRANGLTVLKRHFFLFQSVK